MKAHFHKVPIHIESSFSVRNDIAANFGTILHYHPEFELHYVKKGEGVRFIGNNISNFDEGEMILLGGNLPHTWRCKDVYFEPGSNLGVEACVIHFLPNCFGNSMLNLPEADQLNELYAIAKHGIIIHGDTKNKLVFLMEKAVTCFNLDRLIILMQILHTMAASDEYETIVSKNDFYQSNETDLERINLVCTFTFNNYKKNITLADVASLSQLSVTSFCRYFKLITKKTYFDFLTEVRVNHACRLLMEQKRTVDCICEDCGFHNSSNFYRHFKKVIGTTPMQYRKIHLM
ncbi:MAG: AraC family transcriptional regulator [Chitinophagaceae bacterium]